MRPVTRALVLAALLLVPLAPTAAGGTPQPVPWSPYDTVTTVTALSLAGEGSTLAAALVAPTGASSGTTIPTITVPSPSAPSGPPKTAFGDLAILDVDNGFTYNGSTGTTPLGRTHVAVSRDGVAIASLGYDTQARGVIPGVDPGNPTGSTPGDSARLVLYYQHAEGATRFVPSKPATNLSRFLWGQPAGVLVSADGNRIVAALNDGASFSVLGYTYDRGAFVAQFNFTAAGNLSALAGSADLARIAVVGAIPEVNETHGVLHQLPFSTGTPSATYYERTANGTRLTSVAFSGDGTRIVAGDLRSRLHVLEAGATSAAVTTMPGASERVVSVALSYDGTRLTAAHGGTVASYAVGRAAVPTLTWNLALNGNVVGLSTNRTGAMTLAAVNGTDGGVYALGDADATVLWKVSGSADAVSIDDAGTLAAYAQRAVVSLARLPRQIAFEFAGGLKSSTPVAVKPLGTAAFDLTVRNPGAALEHVAFRGPRDADLVVTADPPDLAVPPGETKRVTLFVAVPRSFATTRTFNATAYSLGSNATDEVTLTLQPQATSTVSLVLSGLTDISAAPGVRADITLAVVNNGTAAAAVGVRAAQSVSGGPLWSVNVEPSSLTLGPNSLTTVRVSVTPPEDALNGTTDHFTVTISGTNVSDSAEFTLRINPSLGVSMDASPRTKLVEPGKVAYYNVTVTNNGSLPRRYTLFNDPPVSQGGKAWGIDVETTPFRLDAGASRTMLVRVFAPTDATPNDRVSVLVRARTNPESINETAIEANLTLFANAIAPIPTTTTPTTGRFLPAPGLALVVVSLATLSIALRPRRRAP